MSAFPPTGGGALHIDALTEGGAHVGEGPVWLPGPSALTWIDIPRGYLHRTRYPTGGTSTIALPWPVTAALSRRGGGAIVTTWTGFAWLAADGTIERELTVLDEKTRMNDAGCDARGRLFVGSTAREGAVDAGALHVVDVDGGFTTIATDLTLPNGMGWSPRGDVFYLADSLTGEVLAFDVDAESGLPVRRRVAASIPSRHGLPDGLCVDESGCLWVALWDGGAVVRLSPEGDMLDRRRLPVHRPTSCTFGGSRHDVLFVTTAIPDDRAASALDGAVLAIRGLGVRGVVRHPFAG